MYWLIFLFSGIVLLIGAIGIAYCEAAVHDSDSKKFVQSLRKEKVEKDAEEVIKEALNKLEEEGFENFDVYKHKFK